MKDATKNHVCRNPDMSADMSLENPTLRSKSVLA